MKRFERYRTETSATGIAGATGQADKDKRINSIKKKDYKSLFYYLNNY
jgi:hypothetical protein